MSEEVTSGEIQRYMERQDKLMSEVISEQKNVGENLSSIKEVLKQVLVQTTKTNGRVNRLEGFRFIAKGVFITIGVMWTVFTFVVPYVKDYYTAKTVSDEEFNNFRAYYEKTAGNKE